MIARPHRTQAMLAEPAYPPMRVAAILAASVCYLSALSFLNARGLHVSSTLVGLTEALIYAVCLSVVVHRIPLSTAAFGFCAFAWIVFTWLVRQEPDVKTVRDLMIPILFLSLGQYVADERFADRCLRWIAAFVIAIGLFEVFFLDAYSQLFNTFSFYLNLGTIRESMAMFEGQMLALNGFRPDGIGRTILPAVFGPHRASSVLIEPVSLGNFAVILLAWALSKPWSETLRRPYFVIAAAILITLGDSRFGMLMSAALITIRLIPEPMLSRLAPTFPFLALAAVLGITIFMPGSGDNVIGRITRSGIELLNFDWSLLMGLKGNMLNYGDMGYAHILSRFGAPLAIALAVALFLVPMADERGRRFRALIVLYMFANLAISGTSMFALKTAGIMWFLLGTLTRAPQREGDTAKAPHRTSSRTPFARRTIPMPGQPRAL